MSVGETDVFENLVRQIIDTNPFIKKRLKKFLADKDKEFFLDANAKIKIILSSMECEDPLKEIVNFFNKMTLDFLSAQIQFRKTYNYPITDDKIAKEAVYKNCEVMTYYMYGLFASYFLWPNHYEIYKYFNRILTKFDSIGAHLEVAPGHGLFTSEVRARHRECKSTLVDISETSLNITKRVLERFGVAQNVSFQKCDFNEFYSESKYDLIVMGEVLEHVGNPATFLIKTRSLLNRSGKIFITTCTDAPAIDHVYHFKSLNEIRELCTDSGLTIEDERAISADYPSIEEAALNRSTINYCALLSG
jgi:2-polyprenyl-3-methyl-5-hydroxy-6-metoxy-1,4-benzoquinol methylase